MKAKKYIWTPSDITKLKKLSKTHTMKEAAEDIGCSENNVKSKAKSLGVSFRKYGELHHSAKYSDHDVYLARELVDAGLSTAEVGRKLEIPQPVVSMYYRNKYRNNDSVQC